MPDDHDDDLSDSEEEEDWGGVWDDRCREICHDMRLNKSNGDHFASERVQELLKKNSKCTCNALSYLHIGMRLNFMTLSFRSICHSSKWQAPAPLGGLCWMPSHSTGTYGISHNLTETNVLYNNDCF